ncbi:PRTRC system protein E [Taibaiella koreensis]|uniref:PRTRC system protein E n=1 Tax=Taibaiella koreensis TaxID=1268548 RepID=UPI000E59C793|nr:PRTRC system protein E [Taibaiella koreensis]
METTFFKQLAALGLKADLHIAIAQPRENYMVVTVRLSDDQCGDDAAKLIPPLNLKGSPEDFDSSFFSNIGQPLKVTDTLFANMEVYLKQQEVALAASKMAKEKAAQEEKNKSEKEKKYDEGLKKAAELEAEGKHREAWMKVPDPSLYPEHAEEIRQKREALSAHFAPSLF